MATASHNRAETVLPQHQPSMMREASNEFKAAVNPVSAEVSHYKCPYSAPLLPLQDTSELCVGSTLQRWGAGYGV